MKTPKHLIPSVICSMAIAGSCAASTLPVFAAQDGQTASATITVGKTVTINGEQFPNVNTYDFQLVPVKAHINNAVASGTDGADVTADKMPLPASDKTKGITTTPTQGTTAGSTKIDVTGFTTGGVNAGTNEKSRSKTNTTSIAFTQAGAYEYKLSEIVPTTKVPGVTYDTNDYFVVIYVDNDTDAADNTIDGVHVSNITAWKNKAGNSDNEPQIANLTANELSTAVSLKDHTGKDVYGKVGHGTTSLDAYKFWNSQENQDLTVTNNVTGTLGDRSKAFSMTATFTGLENGVTYKTTGSNGDIPETFTSGADGTATVKFTLKDDQKAVFKNLPAGATYKITEDANNHTPSYKVTSGGTSRITTPSGNAAENTALSTAQEIFDPGEKDNKVDFTNARNLVTITGVNTPVAGAVLAAGIIGVGALVFTKKKKEDGSIEEA